MSTRPANILEEMAPAAKEKYSTDAAWAQASGLPKETLSRLKGQASCELRTLGALARAIGYTLRAVPVEIPAGGPVPDAVGRDEADRLLDLCASGNADPDDWRRQGSGFFMGGLAVMLASARGFDRERYLRLAESLHLGVSAPEVFGLWLRKSPLHPSGFLPAVYARRRQA
jgi:hypothetical protein